MKSLVKTGLLIISVLTLLVACGGGGGGGGGGSVAVALAKDKTSAIADNTELITVSATFTPALAAGTQVTFTITGAARFADNSQTYNTTVTANPANTATAQVKSSAAGTYTVTATCTGGSSNTTVTFTTVPVTLVSGVISKGLVSGGTVTAYAVSAGVVSTTVLGSAPTASNGTYSIDIGNYTGALMLKVTGGTYLDEATGNTVNLVDQAPSGLRAFVSNAASGTPLTAAVTPLTDLAVRRVVGAITPLAIDTANSAVSTLFGIDNIITTVPVDPASLPSGGASTNAEKYALNLVAISRLSTGAATPITVDTLVANLNTDLNSNGGTFSAGTATSLTTAKTQSVTTLSSYSTLTTALGPVFVIASTSPTLPNLTPINFVVTGPGLIRVLDGLWNMGGAYASTAAPFVVTGGAFPGKAVAYLKCTGAGDVTVKATYQNGSVGSATTSCLSETGRSSFSVYLTAAGVDKLAGATVSSIRFTINAGASTNTTSIVDSSSLYTVASLQQSTALSTAVFLTPNQVLTSDTALFTATYGYNPALPSFGISPISVNGNASLLSASDFVIR